MKDKTTAIKVAEVGPTSAFERGMCNHKLLPCGLHGPARVMVEQ